MSQELKEAIRNLHKDTESVDYSNSYPTELVEKEEK